MLAYVAVAVAALIIGFYVGYWVSVNKPHGPHITVTRLLNVAGGKNPHAKWTTGELIHMASCPRCQVADTIVERARVEEANYSVCVDKRGAPVAKVYDFKIPEGDDRIYNSCGQPLEAPKDY
jgi:hypothetical protein